MRHLIALGAILVPVFIAAGAAQAQDFNLREEGPALGTHITRRVVQGPLPFDKSWEQLTAEQQALVKSRYQQQMPAADEPPFPAHGLGPIYKAIVAIDKEIGIKGELSLSVDVDSQGKAVSVSVLKSPDDQLARAVAAVVMMQEYKPAVCAGQPCRMHFPVRINLVRKL